MPRASAPNIGAFAARIEGSVQGVGFRYQARREAQGLGLVGWIRNAPDGSVEVLAEGATGQLEKFAAWLRKGPPGAMVSRFSLDPRLPGGYFASFEVIF